MPVLPNPEKVVLFVCNGWVLCVAEPSFNCSVSCAKNLVFLVAKWKKLTILSAHSNLNFSLAFFLKPKKKNNPPKIWLKCQDSGGIKELNIYNYFVMRLSTYRQLLSCKIKHLLVSIFICMPLSLLGFFGEKQLSTQVTRKPYCHVDK